MKIEKSVLALVAFVAVFMAVLAIPGAEACRKPSFIKEELFDNVFDEDDSMFDQKSAWIRPVKKHRFNQNGYEIRTSFRGMKGVPATKKTNDWMKVKSHGEGKGGNHWFRLPKSSSGRGRDELFDNVFDEDDSMFDKHRYRKPSFSKDEMADDMFDEDDAMFDQQTRYVQQARKSRFNQKGYIVRNTLRGMKGVPPAKGNWVQQKSFGEGKGGTHWYKKPNFSGQKKATGAKGFKGRAGLAVRAGRGRL